MNLSRHLIPTSRAGFWRLAILLTIFAVLACEFGDACAFWLARVPALYCYARYSPQEGDVVFQSLPHGSLVDAIEGVTHSSYSHCGVVLRGADGKWVVIEAIGKVRETPLFNWIIRARDGRLDVYRLDPKYAPLVPEFAKDLRAYLDYPYDFDYDMSKPDKIYCSDLVFLAFQKASHEQMGKLQKLGDLDWQHYRDFIVTEANGKLPLDRVMITPISLSQATQLHRVF